MNIEHRDDGFWVVGSPNGRLLLIARMFGPFDTEKLAQSFIDNAVEGTDLPMSLREQTKLIKEASEQREFLNRSQQ